MIATRTAFRAQPDFYLLMYDVESDRRRTRLARHLEDAGSRVQKSVFEAFLTPRQARRVLAGAHELLGPECRGIRTYRLCVRCRQVAQAMGTPLATPPPIAYIL